MNVDQIRALLAEAERVNSIEPYAGEMIGAVIRRNVEAQRAVITALIALARELNDKRESA